MQKKRLTVWLAVVCAMSMLAGCGSESGGQASKESAQESGQSPKEGSEEDAPSSVEEENGPAEDAGAEQGLFDENGKYMEEITITGVVSHSPIVGDASLYPPDIAPDNFSYIQAAKDKLNINFEWLWVAPQEQFSQKFGVALASGDLPDIMSVSSVDYELLKENGQLADLSNTLQYADEVLKGYLEVDPSVLESLTTDDGKLYAIPQYYDVRREMNMLYIRQDWLDELEMDIPRTIEELEAVMKAFKEKTGADQAIALSGNQVSDWGLDTKGILNMFGGAPYAWIDKGDGTLVAGEIQPEIKTGLETMAKWYQEGYINREFVAMDVSKAMEDVIAGKTGILLGPWWMYESTINVAMQNNPEARWSTAAIPSDGNGKAMVPRRSMSKYYVVNSECQHPEALIKLMSMSARGTADAEEWAQEANGYVWHWDPTYYGDPSDVKTMYDKFTAALKDDPKAEGPAPAEFSAYEAERWEKMGSYQAFWEQGDTTLLEENVGLFGNLMARADSNGGWGSVEKIAASGDLIYDEYYGPVTDTQKEVSITLNTLLNETYLKIIMGEQPIDAFDKFVTDWLTLGGEDITAEVNEWYASHK